VRKWGTLPISVNSNLERIESKKVIRDWEKGHGSPKGRKMGRGGETASAYALGKKVSQHLFTGGNNPPSGNGNAVGANELAEGRGATAKGMSDSNT